MLGRRGIPERPGSVWRAPGGEFTALGIGWRHSCGLRPEGYAVCWYQPDVSAAVISTASPHLTEAFGGRELGQPVDLFPWPDGGLAVVERQGVIRVYADPPDDGARAGRVVALDGS